MKKYLVPVLMLALALLSRPALADDHEEEKAKDVTLTGEVLDLTCFLEHGGKGESHASCAKSC